MTSTTKSRSLRSLLEILNAARIPRKMRGDIIEVVGSLLNSLHRACAFCKCTELEACPGGCSWTSLEPPLCSRCVPPDVMNFLDDVPGSTAIAPGAQPRKCDKCPEMIFDVPKAHGADGTRPVSIAVYKHRSGKVTEGIAPTADSFGAGISHFANCPKAHLFRGK